MLGRITRELTSLFKLKVFPRWPSWRSNLQPKNFKGIDTDDNRRMSHNKKDG